MELISIFSKLKLFFSILATFATIIRVVTQRFLVIIISQHADSHPVVFIHEIQAIIQRREKWIP